MIASIRRKNRRMGAKEQCWLGQQVVWQLERNEISGACVVSRWQAGSRWRQQVATEQRITRQQPAASGRADH